MAEMKVSFTVSKLTFSFRASTLVRHNMIKMQRLVMAMINTRRVRRISDSFAIANQGPVVQNPD